jgi:hypothetical protein
MIAIRVEGVEDLRRDLTALHGQQLPFALSVALNDTARDVQQALEAETGVFDRPRSFTVRGTNLTRSTKTKLTAEVALKTRTKGGTPVNDYLAAQIEGGSRADKRSEVLLQQAGILPRGYQTRPGSGARMDAYGNMSRGQIVQILSYFRAFGGVSTSGRARGRKSTETNSQKLNRATKPRRPVEYFVVPEGMPGLTTGVWKRTGKKIEPILVFTRSTTYKPIYKFDAVAVGAVEKNFNTNFDRAFRFAIATAR